MPLWLIFWTVCLLVAGVSFALITVMIAWRGIGELMQMIRDLRTNGA